MKIFCISLKSKSRTEGIFHQYDLPPGESVMEVYTDSDWASDKGKRGSVSCVVIFWSGIMLYPASRTQKLVSLSSAEAELYACSSGVSDSILLSRLIAWMTGHKVTTYLYTDSSGAGHDPATRSGKSSTPFLPCAVASRFGGSRADQALHHCRIFEPSRHWNEAPSIGLGSTKKFNRSPNTRRFHTLADSQMPPTP